MKILKGLKINNENKKINASEVALVSNNKYKTLDNAIGDLSDLNTTDKSSAVGAINEVNLKTNNAGKCIRLKKNADQSYSANTEFDVSWQNVVFDNTDGILVKNGNKIECTSGTHTVIVSSFIQFIANGERQNYMYIRHNDEPCAATSLENGNPHLAIPVVLEEGDTILIQGYSSLSGRLGASEDWSGLIVTLLN